LLESFTELKETHLIFVGLLQRIIERTQMSCQMKEMHRARYEEASLPFLGGADFLALPCDKQPTSSSNLIVQVFLKSLISSLLSLQRPVSGVKSLATWSL
jgi:hypothetical protein